MRLLYFLRIIIISVEFIVILALAACIKLFVQQASIFSSSLTINTELTKWAILLPISLFIWCAKEGHDLIFANQEHSKILINWPDYWRLKQHVIVSLIFSIFFCVLSAYPWMSESGISTGEGLTIFFFSCLGSLVVAGHLYFAKMAIKEIILSE